jgi:hypothetical protein
VVCFKQPQFPQHWKKTNKIYCFENKLNLHMPKC